MNTGNERPLDALALVISIAYVCATAVYLTGELFIAKHKEPVQCIFTKMDGFNKVVYIGKGEIIR